MMIKSCKMRQKVLFNQLNVFELFVAELVSNLQTANCPDDQILPDILAKFKAVKSTISSKKNAINLDDGEILAMMLYTYDKVNLYTDLKANLLGKNICF